METIKEILERKRQEAFDRYRLAQQNMYKVTTEAQRDIDRANAEIDQLDRLIDLDWKLYAKNTLEAE